MYHLLLEKGFSKDRIITMAYDDVADSEENPFPGKLFNQPDAEGPGEDVYAGCVLDYTKEDVTGANFAGILLGNGTTGGSGRVLNSTAEDNVLVFYVDHGAPGVLEWPDGKFTHTSELQSVLKQMHKEQRFRAMSIYIEACESGSMLEGLPTDLNIYGVTAVGSKTPSLGTYCGYEAVINGTSMNTCLGDLFAVMFMKFLDDDDGTATMQEFFDTVSDNVATYASLHYGSEINMQYGDMSIANLTTSEFFHGDNSETLRSKPPHFKIPGGVFSAPRLAMDRLTDLYSDIAAMPTAHGKKLFAGLKHVSRQLKDKVAEQETAQQIVWSLVEQEFSDDDEQERVWTMKRNPVNPACELDAHDALVERCKQTDMTSSYALQFHQVIVNLCGHPDLDWAENPSKAVSAIAQVCSDRLEV
jgi:legumain